MNCILFTYEMEGSHKSLGGLTYGEPPFDCCLTTDIEFCIGIIHVSNSKGMGWERKPADPVKNVYVYSVAIVKIKFDH